MPELSSAHVYDEFPLLLTGEADRATVFRVSTHLRECDDCKDELVDAVTAHATLASAARHAADVATGGRLQVPDRHSDVTALLDAAIASDPGAEPASSVDLSPVFEQIRREAAASAAAGEPDSTAATATSTGTHAAPVPLASRRRGSHLRRGLVAAAAVVVLGGGTAVVVNEVGADHGRTVTVGAFGAGRVNASAQIGDGWMKLDASKLPALSSSQYYEVWLVDAPRTGLLALGSLGGDRTGDFAVPAAVMNSFNSIQVTVQDNNGNPAPSNTSVLRATY